MKRYMKSLKEIETKYLSVFGDNSLDRVILCEPFLTENEAHEIIKTLTKAIELNQPLKQIDEKTWKEIVF